MKNIKFKVSQYTFLIEKDKKFYIYNTLSNALLEVDEELYMLLSNHKENNAYIECPMEDDLVSSLMDARFVTENDEDEFLMYKSIITALRRTQDAISLTIAPTMDCCFNCHYCFEKSKRPIYMSEDVMRGIAEFIGSHDNIKRMDLVWFGLQKTDDIHPPKTVISVHLFMLFTQMALQN